MPDLIAKSDLVTITRLNSLVEDRKVANGIEDAHIELEKVLGKTGYALVYANAPSFSAQAPNSSAYVTLLNSYIKPFMAWKAKERSTVDLYAEADKGGVFKKSGNDYESVSRNELGMIQAEAGARADMRMERLIDHLESNTSIFTWYGTNVNGEERIDRESTKSMGGISFRKSDRQQSYRG